MSERAWSYGFKVVTALFVLLQIGLSGALIFHVASSHTERKLRAIENSQNYAEATDERIQRICSTASGPSLIECVRKEIETSNEHRRDEHDLTAQQDMSDWAFWLLWVSIAGVAVSYLAVFFIWRTLDLTRETLVATREMAGETREMGQAQVRAYLTIEGVTARASASAKSNGPVEWHIDFTVRNSGQTPARNVLARAIVATSGGGIPGSEVPTMDIPANSSLPFGTTSIVVQDVDGPCGLDFVDRERINFRCRIEVNALDVFGKTTTASTVFGGIRDFLGRSEACNIDRMA